MIAGTALVAVLAACTGDPSEISFGHAQAAVPTAGASQVVVAITNSGAGDDTLVGAETPAALGVEIHLTEIVDSRATMETIRTVELPAGETVRFRPGGLHLMLLVPDDDLATGATFPMTFRFEHADPVTVEVEVVDLLDLAEEALE